MNQGLLDLVFLLLVFLLSQLPEVVALHGHALVLVLNLVVHQFDLFLLVDLSFVQAEGVAFAFFFQLLPEHLFPVFAVGLHDFHSGLLQGVLAVVSHLALHVLSFLLHLDRTQGFLHEFPLHHCLQTIGLDFIVEAVLEVGSVLFFQHFQVALQFSQPFGCIVEGVFGEGGDGGQTQFLLVTLELDGV